MTTELRRREASRIDDLGCSLDPIDPIDPLDPLDHDEAFVAITRSGARHLVDPQRGVYRRTQQGRSEEWPLFAVLGEVSVARSLLLLVVGEDDRVLAFHTSPVDYLAPLHSRTVEGPSAAGQPGDHVAPAA